MRSELKEAKASAAEGIAAIEELYPTRGADIKTVLTQLKAQASLYAANLQDRYTQLEQARKEVVVRDAHIRKLEGEVEKLNEEREELLKTI